MDLIDSNIARAAQWIAGADAMVIAAGAGMSVDSGLPDFRGSNGIWKTLLPAGRHERDVHAFMHGRCFADNPREAWRFFGRALDACRDTAPHAGYALLRHWAAAKRHGAFVYMSYVKPALRDLMSSWRAPAGRLRPLAAVPSKTFERPFRSRQRPFTERARRAVFIVIAGGGPTTNPCIWARD
jgi:hypothetical protein